MAGAAVAFAALLWLLLLLLLLLLLQMTNGVFNWLLLQLYTHSPSPEIPLLRPSPAIATPHRTELRAKLQQRCESPALNKICIQLKYLILKIKKIQKLGTNKI